MFLFVRCCFTIKKNTLAFPTSFRAIRFVQTNRCPREVIEFKILRKQPLQGRCEREKTENANLSLKLERRQRRREVPVTRSGRRGFPTPGVSNLTWLRGQFDKSRSRGGPHLKEQVSIQVRLSTDICITVMEEISDLIIFPERFRGPLKTLWRPHLTRGPLIAHPCPTPFWRIHVRSRATYEAYVEGSVLVDQCASLIYQHASSHMSFVRFSKKPAAWINAILEQPWSSCVLFVDCPTLA